MEEVKILYETDVWHSHSSKEIVGVFSDADELDIYLKKMVRKRKITQEDYEELLRQNQTQGRQNNFMIEEEELNPKFK